MKKATWLYACGVELPELRWGWTSDGDGEGEDPETKRKYLDKWRDQWGGRNAAWTEARGSVFKDGVRCRPSNLGQTSTTPPEFRDVLLAMARTARMATT